MENENKNEKTCENCRHYYRHYVKQKLKYKKIFCWHCGKNINKSIKSISLCDKWENGIITKEERERAVKETLKIMAEKLSQIALVLIEDNESQG